ncbi:SusC/RagA family TonB-linked outer membrane protein [Negadavirga shengliensis]|uniref:SusC/RagA family TonB-linked outer membrane protein n=1 Tax=Negadavirga shengliensis TaxID=1389218 RepID=A0ABV9SXE3_9BACT
MKNHYKNVRTGFVFTKSLALALLLVPFVICFSYAQETISINGKVISGDDGSPVPGATVLLKNTQIGTVTDLEGAYSIQAPADGVIVVSFIGYETVEEPIESRSIIDIVLNSDTQSLDEFVVTGYSTQRRKNITGSVSVVDVDELKTVPSRSAEQALQGMASGVNVTRSGVPGASNKILIRGMTSFGNTDPLVIVDGIQQNLNNISAQDIESIQVLKDAGAAAIYGVRGANGVILVTTKKGKSGAPTVSYQVSNIISHPLPGNPFNLLNSEEYVSVFNRAFPNNDRFNRGMPDYMYRGPAGAGVAFAGDPEVDPSLYHYASPNRGQNYIIQEVNKEGTDWFHELFKRAPTTEHNITASGGNDNAKYLFSLGFLDQKGTLINTYLKRYSARINTEFNLGKNLRVGENLNIIYRENPGFNENSDFGGIIETVKQQPIVPLKDIMGNWGGTFGGPGLGDGQNPVAVQYRNRDKDIFNEWHIVGNAYAELDLFKNVTARTSFGYNVANSYTQDFNTTQVENVQGNNNENFLSVSSSFASQVTYTNLITYMNTFGRHTLEAQVGSEAIENLGRGVSGSRQRFFSEDFNFLVLGNGVDALTNSSSIYKNSLFSVFGRVDYIFDDKYLFGTTLRRDGSSVFGPEQRYGVFPSFSFAWRLSEEDFMKNLFWLNDFKIRGSYGVLGSQNNVSPINAFSLFGSGMTTTYYDITGSSNSIVQGFATNRIGNPLTGWEENIVSNYGFDMTILDNSLELSVEYYKKKVKGLLFTEPLPAVIIGGASAPSVNIGDIQNSGIDASFQYRGVVGSGFTYSVGANITNYKNMVVNIPDPGYFFAGSHQGVGSMVRNEEGHPVSSFYGYRVIGLFNSQEEVDAAPTQNAAAPGRFRYEDINGDGMITPDDRTHLGDPNPDFTYGLNLNAGYKNFDFSAFFYGSHGNDIFNLTKSYTHFVGFYPTTNFSRDLLNAWTPENTNTNIPVVESQGTFSTTLAPNSFYIEDGSFLKLRSLVLGYTVNPEILRKLYMSRLRVYAQVENLFTLTNYSGLDPELVGGPTSAMGIDRGSYPNNELGVIFGLSVTF